MRIFDESQLRGKGSDCVQWNGILCILNHLTPEVTDKGRSFSVLYIHHPPPPNGPFYVRPHHIGRTNEGN